MFEPKHFVMIYIHWSLSLPVSFMSTSIINYFLLELGTTIDDVAMFVCINTLYGYNICYAQSADKLKTVK